MKMWEEWDDEYFTKIFFDWNIFIKYSKDNEFKDLEENVKKELMNSKNFNLNEEDDKDTEDNVLLILRSFIKEKKYIDVSDYLVNIILRWNYYTSLRSEKELDLNSVKNRLKIDLDIRPLPDVYNNFEEYFYTYFPLFLIETQQLINNKKENDDVAEYDVTIVNDMKEMFNFDFCINIAFDNLIYSNIFYGDLVLLRFIPKKTAKTDSNHLCTPVFSKKNTEILLNSSQNNENDNLSVDSYSSCGNSQKSLDIEETENDKNSPIFYDGCENNKKNFINFKKEIEKDEKLRESNNYDKTCYNELKEEKNKNPKKNNFNKEETMNNSISYNNLGEEKNDDTNDDIYMIRKYCVRHLLGYVVSKNKENIKIKFNLNCKNFDIIDKVRKDIIYEIFCREKLSDYFIRLSKVTSLISTLKLFNCLFNFRNSSILGEVIENEDKNSFVCNSKQEKKRKKNEVVNDDDNEKIEINKEVKMNKDKVLKYNNNEIQNIHLNGQLNEDYLKEKIKHYLKKFRLSVEKNEEKIILKDDEQHTLIENNYDECNESNFSENSFSENDFNVINENNGITGKKNYKKNFNQYRGFKYIPLLLKKKILNMYNKYQLRAINNSIINDGITLIQGPPGTGKTTTILGIISALIFFQTNETETKESFKNEYLSTNNLENGKKRKSPYAWLNYDKNHDYCYINENCFDAMEYEDFHHFQENNEEENKNFFQINRNKNNKNENNYAYAIHLSIMNASNRTSKFNEKLSENINEEDIHKNNENRIKNVIGLTESYYYSYVNNDYSLKKTDPLEKNLNEKYGYSYYVKDINTEINQNENFEKNKCDEKTNIDKNFMKNNIKHEDFNEKHINKDKNENSVKNDMKEQKINKLNLLKNKKILVCAPSNAAIDEILRRLISSNRGILDENGNPFNPIVTRIGGNVSTDLLEFSLEFKEQLFLLLNKNDENKFIKRNLLKTSTIICSTLSSSSNTSLINYIDYFDAIIIDEASQSVELDILIPLSFSCKKIILVGDPKQLSATVFSLFAKKYKYSRSLFERLQKKYKLNKSKYNLLSIQYRMHPEISHFPKKYYYKNKITDAPYFLFILLKEIEINKYIKGIKNKENGYIKNLCNFNLFHFIENNFGNLPKNFNDITLCKKNQGLIDWFFIPLLQHSVFYDISFSKQKKIRNSYINIDESEVVLQFIEFLDYIFTSENVHEWYRRIGIITPYSTEKYFLKKELNVFFTKRGYKNNISNFIDIGTVDGFQGTEKDIIIFVCVRTKGSFKKKKKKNLIDENEDMLNFSSESSIDETDQSNLFFSNYKRLNVALTRARYNLFIFGNCSFLRNCDAWNKIIQHYRINKKIIKIKHKIFVNKMKILSDNINEENLFDDKLQLFNKKIENSFYNKNIIDYNFLLSNEKEDPPFDLKNFLYSSEINQSESVTENESNDRNIYSIETKVQTNNNQKESDIINFFKELDIDHDEILDDSNCSTGEIKKEDIENNKEHKEFSKKEKIKGKYEVSEYKEEQKREKNEKEDEDKYGNERDENLLDKNNIITNKSREQIKFTSIEKNNDREENILVERSKEEQINDLNLENTKIHTLSLHNTTKEDVNVAFNKTTIMKTCDSLSINENESKIDSVSHENKIYLRNHNYFIDTLYNYCKSNKELYIAMKSILPNFCENFLYKHNF
ncbi:DNA2/NAM7 helicase, putative [Plasmodium relictum]|uniref:DNA2/NAM7 helicase, putative n=1 Tax=Plasmodium relictum TaxID=85471 RepID=A0A1J1H423_PLARL|nr:DNA2/NAM7 helicase, putative [Plasmodium relictum]CRG99655.1 DNA2/NAM7 helicase, putative [Plasmodium relictum]